MSGLPVGGVDGWHRSMISGEACGADDSVVVACGGLWSAMGSGPGFPAVFGKPWECGAAVVGFTFFDLFPSGKSVVSLIPERGTVVGAKLFIE